jgi:hypothetical protein
MADKSQAPSESQRKQTMLAAMRELRQKSLMRGQWPTECDLNKLAKEVNLSEPEASQLFKALVHEGYIHGGLRSELDAELSEDERRRETVRRVRAFAEKLSNLQAEARSLPPQSGALLQGAAEARRSARQHPALRSAPYLRHAATKQQRPPQVRPGTPGARLHLADAGYLQPRAGGHERRDRRRDGRRRGLERVAV